MIKLHKTYLLFTFILFLVEVMIAVFIHDNFIRPYVGDLLVVILLYCLVKSFLNISVNMAVIIVLLFSYLIETLQYFNIVHHLGLSDSKIANIIIGNYFTWVDMLAYTLGAIVVLLLEKGISKCQYYHKGEQLWL